MGESDLHKALTLSTTPWQHLAEQALAWGVSLAIGVAVGCIGFAFNEGGTYLNAVKFDAVQAS